MKILITGVAGFIGSSLGDHLIRKGHEIVGVDNFDPFYPRLFKEINLEKLRKSTSFTLFETDIRDNQSLTKVLRETQPGLVIHLAAKAGVRPSIERMSEYYDVNVMGTMNLLESMKEAGCRKLIFASSSSVYGNNKKVPFSEDDFVDHPISPYAATKKSGELLCHVFSHLHSFDITALRFFTVFGPRQRPDLAIHKFTRLIDAGKPIPVFGDGSSTRDFTYIEDIIDGIECSIQHMGGYQLYNLGESRLVSLSELIKMIEHSLGKKAIIDYQSKQPGDVESTYADISKAKARLGYNPKFSMVSGINLFTEWYLEHKHLLYP